MEVILLQDVEKLGLRGDVVSVTRGYACNFLIPRKLAETATRAKVEEIRKRDSRRALQEARSAGQAETIAERLHKTVLRFEMKAGPSGALFGSVTPSDIADEIWRTRKIRIDRRKIELPDPLKRVDSYAVSIHIFEDVNRYRVAADAFERIRKLDLSPIDANLAGAPDLVGDVAGGNRAEESAAGTGLHLEAEHRLVQPLGD